MKVNEKLIELFEEIVEYVSGEFDVFEIDLKDGKQIETSALMLKILSSSNVIVKLCKDGNYPEADVLARTNLEASFHMVSIIKTKNGLKEYLAKHEYGKSKMVNSLISDSELMKTFRLDKSDLIKNLEEIKVNIESYDLGHEKRCMQTAKDAGMTSDYQGAYRLLSQAVHVLPGYLEKYYFKIENGKILGFSDCFVEKKLSNALLSSIYTLLISFKQFLFFLKNKQNQFIREEEFELRFRELLEKDLKK